MKVKACFVLTMTLTFSACAEDSSHDPSKEQAAEELSFADDSKLLEVDASQYESWVYLDIDQNFTETDEAGSWDIAFQRYLIKLNPSSDAQAVVATSLDKSIQELVQAPVDNYRTDISNTEQSLESGLVFGGEDPWYDYNQQSHVLTPKERSYVIRSQQGDFYAIAIKNYYDSVGTSGILTVLWKQLEPPVEEIQLSNQ